ncbi:MULTISPECIES: succinate dehydrogenase hydrophobic membrane anchor subunit [unclassified Arthrobacter]|uniref:succinate dehydrogenase hydrophobic membrane anchor subunit n=1 Tax=unclassified Arthrobacter TaxID=235627 RepID=UPI001E362678|nr:MULTISPECIES: succinate dehydrogenase hydrophobic membrane anchor subunit [unclassified Arthrobacter]MCC9146057.1 succinate dehydrogenase hydrophobic membrane anchor subunit [Arthrobacter sp. zg-Y919]MDK1277286.1 succinate dehydrogenase hydrophobic membrane anchor subunit [Arthrobacter sp. zg.Y919]MDM7990577.1 succinate dehydrogenase hydrophobic membrane anchor subunit [Arthrobacter sp. zg-Y877]WIB03795.1 succinate dehydrogenase hydrophobic membrane anchor subunit [Arthrobacter sp. zg-Y919]
MTTSTNEAHALEAPRSGRIAPRYTRNASGRGNFEMLAWLFMRVSGVILVVLIFTHLFMNLVLGDGIHAVDFGFVAGKWASPLWQVWDLVMLWLAMLHGTNGVRVIINDYADKKATRMWLKTVLYVATFVIIVLGTLVIFTFDPCLAGASAETLQEFCGAS